MHAIRTRVHPRLMSPRCTVVFTPALRTRLGYAACSMPQGLLLTPTRPVRANCRPDMHLGRPPSHRRHTPAAVWGPQSRKRKGHDVVRTNRIPHHVSKTIATHPLPARDKGG